MIVKTVTAYEAFGETYSTIEEAYRAAARLEDARDGQHQRGLAGAVGPQEAVDLAFLDGYFIIRRYSNRMSLVKPLCARWPRSSGDDLFRLDDLLGQQSSYHGLCHHTTADESNCCVNKHFSPQKHDGST